MFDVAYYTQAVAQTNAVPTSGVASSIIEGGFCLM